MSRARSQTSPPRRLGSKSFGLLLGLTAVLSVAFWTWVIWAVVHVAGRFG